MPKPFPCRSVEFGKIYVFEAVLAAAGILYGLQPPQPLAVPASGVVLEDVTLVEPLLRRRPAHHLIAEGEQITAVGIGATALMLVVEHGLVAGGRLDRINAAFFTVNGVVGLVFAGCVGSELVLRADQLWP